MLFLDLHVLKLKQMMLKPCIQWKFLVLFAAGWKVRDSGLRKDAWPDWDDRASQTVCHDLQTTISCPLNLTLGLSNPDLHETWTILHLWKTMVLIFQDLENVCFPCEGLNLSMCYPQCMSMNKDTSSQLREDCWVMMAAIRCFVFKYPQRPWSCFADS